MSISVLVTINGLLVSEEISEHINGYVLTNNNSFRDMFLKNPYLLENVGRMFYHAIEHKYCYIWFVPNLPAKKIIPVRDLDKYFNDITIDILKSANKYLSMLWLIKDCNVKAMDAVSHLNAFAQKSSMNSERQAFYNAKGGYSETNFSKNELQEATIFYSIVCKYCFTLVSKNNVEKTPFLDTEYEPHQKVFLEYHTYNRIEKAMLILETARSLYDIPFRISMYMSICECLFANAEKAEITFKLAKRISTYLTNVLSDRIDIGKIIKDGYTIRSSFMHGLDLKKADQKKNKIYEAKAMQELSVNIDNLLRRILRQILLNDAEIFSLNDGERYSNLIRDLDYG